VPASGGPPDAGIPAPLKRGVVVTACVDFIDAHGVDRLTMRGLGLRLGVKAMSIYRYTSGRESLLQGAVAHVLGDVYHEMTQRRWPSWSAYARHLARAVRRVAIQHPQLFPVMAAPPTDAGFLCPPLSHLPLVEDLLWTLRDHGLSDRQATTVYRDLSQFLLGSLLLETAPRREPRTLRPAATNEAEGDLSPAIRRLHDLMVSTDERVQFEHELDALLERLHASVECSDA